MGMFDFMFDPGPYIPPCESEYFDEHGTPIGYYKYRPPKKNKQGFYEQPDWVKQQRAQDPFWNMPNFGFTPPPFVSIPREESAAEEYVRENGADWWKDGPSQPGGKEIVIDVTFKEVE